MQIENRPLGGVSRLVVLTGFALVMLAAASRTDAGMLGGGAKSAQLAGAFKNARIGDDPDVIPYDQSVVDDPGSVGGDIVDDPSPFGGPIHIRNPMVACTVVGLGEDPDPIPRIWWLSCRNIGNDPDPIPPNH